MLLMSRNYALASEEARAELLIELEPALLTPEERAQGIKLARRKSSNQQEGRRRSRD
jgi:hypothetical protein